MSEKFNRKSFFQRAFGGLAALTLAKTEAKPVLNQMPAVVAPPIAPILTAKITYSCTGMIYSGVYSCTGRYYY